MVLLLQGDALLVTLAKNLSPSQWGDIIFYFYCTYVFKRDNSFYFLLS